MFLREITVGPDELNEIDAKKGNIIVVYDGQCPFCSQYVNFLRLKETLDTVELLDARSSDDPRVRNIATQVDLDEGMAVVMNKTVYHGEAAVRVLSAMTTRSGWLNRLNAWCFSHQGLSTSLYCILKFGRRITLWILKVPKIGAPIDTHHEL